MWKKALTPISVIVLLVGVVLIVISTMGGNDSDDPTSSSSVSVVGESVPTGSVPGETVAPVDSGAPSGTTAAPATTAVPPSGGGSTTSPSSTIFFPSFPSFVLPSSTFVIPSFPSLVPQPSFSIAPGVIDALSCGSFQNCAQKLYQSWKDGTLATATLYATQAAVDTLSAYSFGFALFGPWPANVTQVSPTAFQAQSNAFLIKPVIRFNFTAGQSGFKVQSVQIS